MNKLRVIAVLAILFLTFTAVFGGLPTNDTVNIGLEKIQNNQVEVKVYDAAADVVITKNQIIFITATTGYVDDDLGDTLGDIFVGFAARAVTIEAGNTYTLSVWTFGVYYPTAAEWNADGSNTAGLAGESVYFWDVTTWAAGTGALTLETGSVNKKIGIIERVVTAASKLYRVKFLSDYLSMNTGDAVFSGDLYIGGTLTVTGATTLSSTLEVTTSVKSPIFDALVAGALTIGAVTATSINLSATGEMSTFLGTLNCDEAVTFDTSLDVDGACTFDQVTIDTTDGAFQVDGTNLVKIDSNSTIGIGTDADAFAINIGTGAAARTITIGNITGATSLILNCGTGNCEIANQAIATPIIIGNAASASLTMEAGVGAFIMNADTTAALTSAGAMTFDSTAAGVSIDGVLDSNFTVTGAGQNLTILSTGGSLYFESTEDSIANSITILASAADSGIDIDAGTAGINIATTGAGDISIVPGVAGTLRLGASGEDTRTVGVLEMDEAAIANSTLHVVGVITTDANNITSYNIGAIPVAGTIAVVEHGTGSFHKTVITLTDFVVGNISAAASEAIGALIYTFPAGVHMHKVTYANPGFTYTSGLSAGNAAWGIGSAVGTGAFAVLNGTPAFMDYITEQNPADVAGTADVTGPLGATAGILTGISLNKAADDKTVYLNIAGAWANAGAEDLTASGVIVITWEFLQ